MAGILFTGICQPARAETNIRVGVYQNEPKEFITPDGTVAGFFPEILTDIADKEGWRIEWVEGTWTECMQRLVSGEIDLLPDVAYTLDRAKLCDFNKETVLYNWSQVYVPIGSKIQSFLDLDGKKISVLKGSIQASTVKATLDQFGVNATLVECKENSETLQAVKDGQVDAGITNRLYGDKNAEKYSVEPTPILVCPAELRFAVPKGKNAELLNAIDRRLLAMKADKGSVYYKATDKWLGLGGEKLVIPKWVWWFLISGAAILLLLALHSWLLRNRVNAATRKLKEDAELLTMEIRERERAENDLRKAHEHLRSFIDADIVGVVVSSSSGRVIEANDYYLNLIGYTREEFEQGNVDWRAVTPPEWRAADERSIEELHKRGSCGPYEKEYIRRDGTRVSVFVSDALLPGPEEHIAAFIIDITELKRSQEEIRASEERFQLSMEATNDGLWDWNVATNEVYCSPACFRMLGYEVGGFPGTIDSLKGLIHPDDAERAIRANMDCVEGRCETFEVECRLRTASGGWRWILARGKSISRDSQGRSLRLVGTNTDITERKRAEEALRESEEQLRSLFDNMLNGFALHEIVCDANGKPVDYRFLDINLAFEHLTGLKAENIIGKTVMEVLPGTEQFWIEAYGNVALTGRPATFDGYTKTLNKHFEIAAFSPGLNQFACLFTDVTERKLAVEALREANARMKSFIDSRVVGIVIATPSGKVVEANDYYLDLIGYTRGEYEQGLVDWRAITPPEWIPADEIAIGELRETGVCVPYEKEYVRRDGTRVPVLISDAMLPGTEEHIAAFVLNLTERKQAELRYKSLFENMLNGFAYMRMIYDGEKPVDFEYLAVNQAFESLTGLKDVVGKRVTEVIPGIAQSDPGLLEFYGKVAQTGVPESAETWLEALNSWLALSVYSPEPGYAVVVFDNITERKRAEEELLKYQEHLEAMVAGRTRELEEQAKKLSEAYAQMESFSYSVSHDLRAPLRHIQGFTDLLLRNAGDALDSESRRLLDIVISASSEMGRLIDELLTYSKTGRSEITRQEISLDKLVKEVYSVLGPAREGRNITLNVGKLPVVMGDNALISVVLSNLLGNAVKFTRGKEDATITVSCQGIEDRFAIIRIEDNGAGFDMRYASKLFGVFQRLHSLDEFEGSGIGLATVRQIINRHGGRVWAHGEVGKGACFYFTLESA